MEDCCFTFVLQILMQSRALSILKMKLKLIELRIVSFPRRETRTLDLPGPAPPRRWSSRSSSSAAASAESSRRAAPAGPTSRPASTSAAGKTENDAQIKVVSSIRDPSRARGFVDSPAEASCKWAGSSRSTSPSLDILRRIGLNI